MADLREIEQTLIPVVRFRSTVGVRVEESDLRGATVDLMRSGFKVPDSKTEAGIRKVEMSLYLRDELVAYVVDRREHGLPCGPTDYFLGTATGKRRDPDRSATASSAERSSARTPTALMG